MATASIHSWNLPWREFWQRISPGSAPRECIHAQTLWRCLRSRPGVLLDGSRYCLDHCLELALNDALRRTFSVSKHMAAHRIPLGLLLLSRQHLTVEQLQAALETQRRSGRGKIGEWLQALGFVDEQQVTAALARQWSCPVLRANTLVLRPRCIPQIPLTLLERLTMIPVDYVVSTSTLHMAFGEGIDYSVLYAIEQMIECRTEPCMAAPSFVRSKLQLLSGSRGKGEVVFERVNDGAEFSRIIRSYCARLTVSEIRLANCGPYLWVRLLRPPRSSMDLLMRLPQSLSTTLPLPSDAALPT